MQSGRRGNAETQTTQKELISMNNINPNPENSQVEFQLSQNAKPILGITRIDRPFITSLYIMAWTMIPPLYTRKISKTANRQIVDNYIREFRSRACQANISIGRGACLKSVFASFHRGTERKMYEGEKARALMAEYLRTQFQESEQ